MPKHNSISSLFTLSIVFVHGLNPSGKEGHAISTWTHENGTFWPQKLLLPKVPFARVMIFSYNSAILKAASNVTVGAHATSLLDRLMKKRTPAEACHRPIIFIAHSMGGLVVKQALIFARNGGPPFTCIKNSTYGLVLFAVPHRGGNKADIGDSLATICCALTGEPKNALVKQLKKKSPLMDMTMQMWSSQTGDYEVLTYYETKQTKLKIKKMVVIPQVIKTVCHPLSQTRRA